MDGMLNFIRFGSVEMLSMQDMISILEDRSTFLTEQAREPTQEAKDCIARLAKLEEKYKQLLSSTTDQTTVKLMTTFKKVINGLIRVLGTGLQYNFSGINEFIDNTDERINSLRLSHGDLCSYLINNDLDNAKNVLTSQSNVQILICQETVNSACIPCTVVLYYNLSSCDYRFIRCLDGKTEKDVTLNSPVPLTLEEVIKRLHEKIAEEKAIQELANM